MTTSPTYCYIDAYMPYIFSYRKTRDRLSLTGGSMPWRPTGIRHGWRLRSPLGTLHLQPLQENPAGESSMPTTTRKSSDTRTTCGFQSRGAARRSSATESCRTTAAMEPSPTRSTTVWTAALRSWAPLRKLLRSRQP